MNIPLYVVIGTTEQVYQEKIGEPFVSSFDKSIVEIFSDEQLAKDFIEINRLKKPQKQTYSGTKYFKNGYYELEIEPHYVEIPETIKK
jgi:hypothetical protein